MKTIMYHPKLGRWGRFKKLIGMCQTCSNSVIGKVKTPLVVLGELVETSSEFHCVNCVTKHMESNVTYCGCCGGLIFPGEAVGVASENAPHPYTHLTNECSPYPGLFCGHWDGNKMKEYPWQAGGSGEAGGRG
jgi:hypothetical protein